MGHPFLNGGGSPAYDGILFDALASWWSGPQAIKVGGSYYLTGISATGKQVAGIIPADGTSATRVEIGTTDADDHNTPGMLVESDQVAIVAWCGHNADNNINVRKGQSVGSLSDLLAATTINCGGATTYAQLYREPGTSNIIIFTRIADRYWYLVRSTDWGESWGTPTALFDAGISNKSYVTAAQEGALLRVAVYGHPTSSTLHEIYACTISLATGEIAKLDGTAVDNFLTPTALPVAVSSLTLVYDPPEGSNVRLFDVSDQWEIGFCEWTSDDDAAYKYLHYDDGTFTKRDMVATGAVFGYDAATHYHGGMAFPRPAVGGVVYLTREDDSVWTLERWQTANGGQSWTTTVLFTSTAKLIRPMAVVGGSGVIVRYAPHYGAIYTDYDGDTLFFADS